MRRAPALLLLVALSSPSAGFAEAKKDDVAAGHSLHGAAFNEGPRQRAYLMGGTGNVHLAVTTKNELAQKFIDQGVGQMHGFWYFEAERSFRQAAMIDPDCAIAYWGMAMANKNNSKRAKGFIAEAVKRKPKCSERERMYVDALNAYINATGKARSKRGRTYAEALKAIAKKYPNDLEAKAFQGLFYYSTRASKPALKHEDVDKLLKEILAVNPLHPVHHYRIHLWDNKTAANALDSSAKGGESSPGIAHMWHMPGHIYSKLKRYSDAAWQQEASARVDHAHMIRDRVLPDQIHNFAHNNEWLIRNLINVGRMHDATDLARNMIELPRHPKYNTAARGGRSASYGRQRLFDALTKFEQWRELIRLADTLYLEPTTVEREQIKRRRYMGRAYYALNDLPNARKILKELDEELTKLKADQKQAEDRAVAKVRQQHDNAPVKALRPDQQPSRFKSNSPTAKLNRAIGKARTDARRPFSTRVRALDQAVRELKAREQYVTGDRTKAIAAIKKAGSYDHMEIARLQLTVGDKATAEKTVRDYLKSHKNEVLPLAQLIEVLWQIGKKDEAQKSFGELRKLAGQADLDAPIFKRLAPIAKAAKLTADWRTPQPRPKDFGKRPDLDSLGPFRWRPSPAEPWSLADVKNQRHSLAGYEGRPVVVIFYLGYGCLHCAEQLQAFAPKAEAFRKAGIELIAISTDDRQSLQKSLDNYKDGDFPFPLVADDALGVFKAYRCYDDFEQQPLHGTFLVDGAGLVRWQDVSYEPFMQPDFLLSEAKRLLAQSAVHVTSRKVSTPVEQKPAKRP